MDMRCIKPKGIGDCFDEGGAGILKTNPSLDVGFDRAHRDRRDSASCRWDPQARHAMEELERGRDIHKRPVGNATAAHGNADRSQESRPPKNARRARMADRSGLERA
jgi:hypothetical protein